MQEHNQRPPRGWGRGGRGRVRSAGGLSSRPLMEGFAMSRMSLLSSPLLLGFEEMERLIDRVGKGDGYPPYNIERIAANGAGVSAGNVAGDGETPSERMDRLRITLAVAGFRRDQLE